jgi:hypothetical protein
MRLTKILMLALLVAIPTWATLIVEVPGPSTGGSGNRVFATSWTQTGTYNNVSISADLSAIGTPGVTATAWLTTDIGSGATIADQVATTTVTSNNLFSGLTLGPDTYFLVISIESGVVPAFWSSAFSPVPTTAANVTIGASYFGDFNVFPAFGPSGDLVAASSTQFLYRVESIADPAEIPEPATLSLLGVAMVFMAAAHVRSRKART